MTGEVAAGARRGPIEAIGVWWFEPVPTRRVELCRRATFGYAGLWLLVRARYIWGAASLGPRDFRPVGMLSWLGEPPPRSIVMLAWAVGLVACMAVCCGRARRLAPVAAGAALLFIATLVSSFGQVFHSEHLLVIHLFVLAAAANIDSRSGDRESGWPLNLMMSATAVTYVAAGLAKLRFSGAEWVSGDVLRQWVAVDNLRKVLLDDPASTVGGRLAGVAWVWGPIAVATLLVELGAPVALRRGRVRLAWVAGAWLFHVGILALMAISFPYQLSGVAFVAYLRTERIEGVLRRRVEGAARTARSLAVAANRS